VTIKNLGALKEATIEIKPLTIFVGPNNAGKSWTAYALANIFSPIGWNSYSKAYLDGKTNEKYPLLDKSINEVINKGSTIIDLEHFAKEYGKKYINDVARFSPNWLNMYLPSKRLDFSKLYIHIDFDISSMLDRIFIAPRSRNNVLWARKKDTFIDYFKRGWQL
jgi:hypothetical protein